MLVNAMKSMFYGKIREGGITSYFGSIYTDDKSEVWHYEYATNKDYVEAKVQKVQYDDDGREFRLPKFENLPLAVSLSDINDQFLSTHPEDPADYNTFKKGLKIFLNSFPELKNETKLEEQNSNKWEIKIARYFGYNETTLALLKSPDGRHYIARSAGYPYGRPQYDKSILNWKYMSPTHGRLHWNDHLNDIAASAKQDLGTIARELKALCLIPCISADPREEFEDRAENERFETREKLAEIYETDAPNKSSLFTQFMRAARGRKNPLNGEEFNNIDVNRQKWYDAERLPKGFRDTFLSPEDVKELAEQVCHDFGIPAPKRIRLSYPKKPGLLDRFKKPKTYKYDGIYYPESTNIAIRFHPQVNGFSKHTLLHELAHHIDNLFVYGGEKPSSSHGMRFKKIHMHLMHHYDDIPVEDLLHSQSIRMAYGSGFPLTEDDILYRNFTERRTVDILPAEKKETTIGEIGGFTYISGGTDRKIIPFRDFDPSIEI